MSTSSRIFHLLDILQIDQKDFADGIGLTNKVVSKWKSGQLKSYTKYLREIVGFFGVPPDYFLERGVYKNWEQIMEYPISVYMKLCEILPLEYWDPMIGKDIDQQAWLDKRMCYNESGQFEVDLINWFYRNVKEVIISKDDDIPEIYSPAEVTLTLTDRAIEQINQIGPDKQKMRPSSSEMRESAIPVESNAQSPMGLTSEEMDMVEAYRAADDRAKSMVDLALEPWKKRKSSGEAM